MDWVLTNRRRKEKPGKGRCIPESRDLLPGFTLCDVWGSYREDFFFVVDFFIRTAAFFTGFFLAILGM
jgi:hypothetical protein